MTNANIIQSSARELSALLSESYEQHDVETLYTLSSQIDKLQLNILEQELLEVTA